MKRVAVLASGRGSNLGALLAAADRLGSYAVVAVVSNVAGAPVLALARDAGVEAIEIPSRGCSRENHEALLLGELQTRAIDILCLAGYMRVLSPGFVRACGVPVLNIHPSLLPAFPGMHAQKQALEYGVRVSGATVHLVDEGLDSGPIILQEAVAVLPGDTESDLSARILEVEHRLYPKALDLLARGRLEIDGRRVRLAT